MTGELNGRSKRRRRRLGPVVSVVTHQGMSRADRRHVLVRPTGRRMLRPSWRMLPVDNVPFTYAERSR